MSAEPAITRTWSVGRYTAHLSVARPKPGAVMCAVIEWTPGVPRDFTDRDYQKYRDGRDRALSQIAAELGINVAVVEA
ncbi:hypothetical protein [Piscinibacter koreensis]|uniref:Uncharacterized protein n=1 Tax=Piscinibacter koreensis TaxID=2742824 RepID=A0A7Y6TY17_9BURK|nr:hypothetical protein [Schlegelella koreensis]NUZ07652.1 hypothetical protein [Schlegelella koreensis]